LPGDILIKKNSSQSTEKKEKSRHPMMGANHLHLPTWAEKCMQIISQMAAATEGPTEFEVRNDQVLIRPHTIIR
jgi:hypothetical protein